MRVIDVGRYSDAEADEFVRRQTGGEVYIERDDRGARLRRRGFSSAIELLPELKLEPGTLVMALDGWRDRLVR